MFAIQIPIFIFLAVSLIPLNVKFSLFGFAPDNTMGLREILLIISACVAISESATSREICYIKEMLSARAEKLAAGNEDARRFLLLPYGLRPDFESEPTETFLSAGWPKWSLTFMNIAVQAILAIVVAVTAITIHVMVMIDICSHPSISTEFSGGVVCFVVLADVFAALEWYSRKGLLPYRSTRWQEIFAEWKKKEPKLHDDIFELARRQHQLRGPLAQIFGRPTPIKTARAII